MAPRTMTVLRLKFVDRQLRDVLQKFELPKRSMAGVGSSGRWLAKIERQQPACDRSSLFCLEQFFLWLMVRYPFGQIPGQQARRTHWRHGGLGKFRTK
jgi:hypothetical protein